MSTSTESLWSELESIIHTNAPSPISQTTPEILSQLGTPSASIAVLDNNSITAKCYSTLNNNTETVFQACSISKPVAAMAAMKLVSQNRLSLDEPITKYLSESVIKAMTTPETAQLLECVTVKQLLSHTAGLTVSGFPGYADDIPEPETIIVGQPPSNTPQIRISGLPGHRFSYSGGGLTVLQMMLQHTTQKPFSELMQDLVLTPLDMTRSFYKTPGKGDNHALSFYTGVRAAEVPFHVYPEQAAAGLWTTPTDLLKVVRAMQDSLLAADDDKQDSSFLPRDLARKIFDEVSNDMALGWRAPKNGVTFSHSGSNFGFRCYLFGYADLGSVDRLSVTVPTRSGVCVMTNSELGYPVVRKLVHAITYTKDWPNILEPTRVDIPFRAQGVMESKAWMDWCGRWGQDWEILAVADAPCIRFQGLPPVKLRPAVLPNVRSKSGSCIDLVFEGLEMMARLRSVDDKRFVDIWHGPQEDITILEKS